MYYSIVIFFSNCHESKVVLKNIVKKYISIIKSA